MDWRRDKTLAWVCGAAFVCRGGGGMGRWGNVIENLKTWNRTFELSDYAKAICEWGARWIGGSVDGCGGVGLVIEPKPVFMMLDA